MQRLNNHTLPSVSMNSFFFIATPDRTHCCVKRTSPREVHPVSSFLSSTRFSRAWSVVSPGATVTRAVPLAAACAITVVPREMFSPGARSVMVSVVLPIGVHGHGSRLTDAEAGAEQLQRRGRDVDEPHVDRGRAAPGVPVCHACSWYAPTSGGVSVVTNGPAVFTNPANVDGTAPDVASTPRVSRPAPMPRPRARASNRRRSCRCRSRRARAPDTR